MRTYELFKKNLLLQRRSYSAYPVAKSGRDGSKQATQIGQKGASLLIALLLASLPIIIIVLIAVQGRALTSPLSDPDTAQFPGADSIIEFLNAFELRSQRAKFARMEAANLQIPFSEQLSQMEVLAEVCCMELWFCRHVPSKCIIFGSNEYGIPDVQPHPG